MVLMDSACIEYTSILEYGNSKRDGPPFSNGSVAPPFSIYLTMVSTFSSVNGDALMIVKGRYSVRIRLLPRYVLQLSSKSSPEIPLQVQAIPRHPSQPFSARLGR